MKLEDVLSALGEEDCLEIVSPHWEESQVAFPDELPDFLQPEHISENRKWGRLAEYMEPQILEAARRIAGNPNLLRLAWHCYWLEYHPDLDCRNFIDWPTLEKSLGKDFCGIFYLLVGMGMVPIVRGLHKKMGVDEKITGDTLSNIRDFNWNYRKGHDGRLGIFRNQLFWYKYHVSGELFRIGRMQYFIHEFTGCAEIYRNRRTNEVLALAENGMKMTDEGYVVFRGEEGTETWTTTHVVDTQANTATGYVVSPKGMTLKRKITLDLSVWRRVLGRGDLMLSMHIPAGGQMALKKCIESARDAFVFFEKHFPHRSVVGIDCYSWIFGNQLEDILDADSNLVELLREGYLYPMPTSRTEGLFFIFYRTDVNLEDYPRDTKFQQQILDWVLAGKPWRGSGWFVLKDDAEHFGKQFYRSNFPPKGVKI
ncbi:MAG: acyltransferase domain-containing protein [Planctomycetota bacterium]|nr:acyltransferase domain-containing protein [Planctomycetota bacterium]